MTKALLEAMWLDGGPIGIELKSPGVNDGVKWGEDWGALVPDVACVVGGMRWGKGL